MLNTLLAKITGYSRYCRYILHEKRKETWAELLNRCTGYALDLGKLTPKQFEESKQLIKKNAISYSGRWNWIAGTEWVKKPANILALYNCTSITVESISDLNLIMLLAMCGCGVGTVIEKENIYKLPPVRSLITLAIVGKPGNSQPETRVNETLVEKQDNYIKITVGDSKEGWCDAYKVLLDIAFTLDIPGEDEIIVDMVLDNVRPKGEPLHGFGGVANPRELANMFLDTVKVLNKAIGRNLSPTEVGLLVDIFGKAIVAGSIRRVAIILQGSSNDIEFANSKDNLWMQDEGGKWRIDPDRDALRMANHTRVFHHKPTKEECIEAVRKQFHSGEGAIEWAGEAVARSNADLLHTHTDKKKFLDNYPALKERSFEGGLFDAKEVIHRGGRFALNPCAEIISKNFMCNLSEVHLNMIDPLDKDTQNKAFYYSGMNCAILLNQKFVQPKLQYSRELDPIVGVSLTGLFDFFVNLFGVKWLEWWQSGRLDNWSYIDSNGVQVKASYFKQQEKFHLETWKKWAFKGVWEYCDQHELRRPNRVTCLQPAGTKSLLTNASPGWHPPFGLRYIRRVSVPKNDPIALAAMECGAKIIPSAEDKDESGNLYDDINDDNVNTWMIEIPVEVPWANIEGADKIDISKFSALALFDFYMQVQKCYTTHNTSGTILFTEEEIEPLGNRIFESIRDDEGYISCALLARFDAPFPRLPFERIDKETYDKLHSMIDTDKVLEFDSILNKIYKESGMFPDAPPSACEGMKCEMGDSK